MEHSEYRYRPGILENAQYLVNSILTAVSYSETEYPILTKRLIWSKENMQVTRIQLKTQPEVLIIRRKNAKIAK